MKCKVIAATNQKGGVGKTTTALNMSVALAQQGYNVLTIDADPQANLTISLGIKEPDNLEVGLSNILQRIVEDRDFDLNMGIMHHKEGIDFIPSNIELASFETRLVNTMSRELVLRTYLYEIKDRYDYIIIDCSPSLGMMTINALSAADSVIIPSQPNFLSVKGLNLLMRTIGQVKKQINPKLEIYGVLLTMVNSRTNNAKNIIGSLREMGNALKVYSSEIPYSVRAAECCQKGESIFLHDGNGKVAQAYTDFAKEVVEDGKIRENRFRSERGVR